MSQKISLSIVTIVYNNVNVIEKTIQSVINQTYKDFEYIVIDGGSTDGTIEIIKKYEGSITKWISEPDKGISDAFNKGVLRANGKWINFMNSGDRFADVNTLSDMIKVLQTHSEYDGIYGKVCVVNQSGHKLKEYGTPFSFKKFTLENIITHQSLFLKREFFDKYGLFDEKLKIVMDYDLFLRAGKHLKVKYHNCMVALVLAGGVSQSNFDRLIEEIKVVLKKHTNQISWVIDLYYKWKKMKYRIRAFLFSFDKKATNKWQ